MKTIKLFLIPLVVFGLLFLPFQRTLVENFGFPEILLFADEFLVVVFFVLLMVFLWYLSKIKKKGYYILMALVLFSVIGFFSGIYNGNSFNMTLVGTVDYIKNFLFIVALSFFSFQEKTTMKIYRLLRALAVFISLVSGVLFVSYFFGVEKIWLLGGIAEVRYGLTRVSPFFIHPNIAGLYSLLFLIFELQRQKKFNLKNIFLVLGVVLSVSKMLWFSSLVIIFFIFLGNKKITLAKLLIAFGLLGLFSPILMSVFTRSYEEISTGNQYRGYVIRKSLEIWRHSPVFGFGPGTYGGVVSVKFNSPIYRKYDFADLWYEYGIKGFHSLDMFWMQILVEMGLLGTIFFVYFLFMLNRLAWNLSLNCPGDFSKNMYKGLSLIPLVIFIYLFGSGLNLTPFIVTYTILYGLMLGTKSSDIKNEIL